MERKRRSQEGPKKKLLRQKQSSEEVEKSRSAEAQKLRSVKVSKPRLVKPNRLWLARSNPGLLDGMAGPWEVGIYLLFFKVGQKRGSLAP